MEKYEGRCALHFASGSGNAIDLLDLWSINPQMDLNERDYDKRTALHIAASNGNLNICELLVSRGADIKAEDRWGHTPVDHARLNNHLDCENFLRSRGGVNKTILMRKQVSFRQVDPKGMLMVFLFSAAQGDVKTIQTLLGANMVGIDDTDGDKRTATHLAASEGKLDVLKFLIDKGANINLKDRFGNRPLNDATRGEYKACIELLLSNGAIFSSSVTSPKDGGENDIQKSPKVFNLKHASKEALIELHSRGIREFWSWDVSDFEIEDVAFAKGAGGEVFKARFREMDCVAKTIGKVQASSKQNFTDLANEIQLMSSIRHPNIVTFFGACFQLSPPVMLIEYCSNGNLETRIIRAYAAENRVKLTDTQKLKYAHQMALAMTFLHRFHVPIIHRDLKPSNILLTAEDNIKITDFGLAKFTPQALDKTSSSDTYKMTGETGSYRFMAPEVFQHQHYDHSVDVYAYTMIIYWLFSGMRPFSNLREGLDAVKSAAQKNRPPLNAVKETRIAGLIEQGWAHNPADRPSFESIAKECEEMKVMGTYNKRNSRVIIKNIFDENKSDADDVKMPRKKSVFAGFF